MIHLLFIRHGATEGNLHKRYIGSTDEPLCETGVEQIRLLKGKKLTADAVFVSPMLRTRQTAELLFPGVPHTVVDDLRETDFGVFEGRTAEELEENADYRSWVDSWCRGPIPGGEDMEEVKARCCRAFEASISSCKDGSTVAFVVHGGTIMALMEAFARPKQDFYTYHVANGQYILGDWDGTAILSCGKSE